MFLPFRMGPAASGRRLCDIDKVLFRITQSRVKNGKFGIKIEKTSYRYIFVVEGLPIFDT